MNSRLAWSIGDVEEEAEVKSEPYTVEPISKAESDILLNIAENGAHLDDVFWEQFKVEINRLVHRGYAYFTDTSGGGPGYANRTVTLTQKGVDALAMWRKESGARLQSLVADVLKHLPTKHDQKTHGHPVTGSKDEAEEFVKDSAIKETYYHGAKYSDEQMALRVSHPEETAAVWGRGVYLTSDPKETKQYGSNKFAVKVKAKNPLFLPTDASTFQKLMEEIPASQHKEVEKRIRGYNDAVKKRASSSSLGDEVKMEVAKKLGYDDIVVLNPNNKWLIVPDPAQVMVIKSDSEGRNE